MHRALAIVLSAFFLASLACQQRSGDGKQQASSLEQKPPSEPARSRARRRIAVIPKGTTHEFWKAVHAGANKAGAQLGVEIIWKGPVREDDRAEQVKVVENFTASRVDGIVLAPLDDTALIQPAKDAVREKIPVVIIDSDIQWTGRLSFVATDNYKGGAVAAKRLGEILKGRGRVLVLRYQEGSASTTKREEGFLDTIRSDFPSIEVVSSNRYGGATTESAYATAENLLVKFRRLDGMFCPNESTTFGMLRALQDGGRVHQVAFVGFDSSVKLVEALRKGELQGLILQNPMLMGELGVRTLVAALDGQRVQARIDTGVVMATPQNMDKPDIRALLAPDLSRWLK